MEGTILNEFDVTIYKKENVDLSKGIEEIWAKISNSDTGELIEKCIWWKDNKGRYHDESMNLPSEFRDKVDNAWIEFTRK